MSWLLIRHIFRQKMYFLIWYGSKAQFFWLLCWLGLVSKGRPDACATGPIPSLIVSHLLSSLFCVTHPVEITLEYSLPFAAYIETAKIFLPIQPTEYSSNPFTFFHCPHSHARSSPSFLTSSPVSTAVALWSILLGLAREVVLKCKWSCLWHSSVYML